MKHLCCFSEAIREGAKLRPQAFNGYARDGGTCAIGAGLEAMLERPLQIEDCLTEGGLRSVLKETCFWDTFAYLHNVAAAPCGCAEPIGFQTWDRKSDVTESRLDNIIVHLNNEHHWTREAIADWLEQEENKLGFVTVVESESESPELVEVV